MTPTGDVDQEPANVGSVREVRKQRNGLDAAEPAMVNAGRLRSCAGCWIQHKKVPALGFTMV